MVLSLFRASCTPHRAVVRVYARPLLHLFQQQQRVPVFSSSGLVAHRKHGRGSVTSTAHEEDIAAPQQVLTDSALRLARTWTEATSKKPASSDLVSALSSSEAAVSFVMKFTDWVMRPSNPRVAAGALRQLLASDPLPSFFTFLDSVLVRAGAAFSPILPAPVISLARLRMRSTVSAFVGPVEQMRLDPRDPVQRNVNLLGEAVLGNKEAAHRREEAQLLLQQPGVNYVSVKVSGVTSQLNRWDFDGSLKRVKESLRPLLRQAATSQPRVLVNLDMEEYHDLEITMAAFTSLLDEEEFLNLDAGIVLQAYLPDALPALQHLVAWAHERPGNAIIKIRLVKGANLAMEKVDAAIHGWEQAPFETKSDTDANYLRCLDWVLTPEHTRRVRIGVASHNIFLLAYAHTLAVDRGVQTKVGFEMLQGMTPGQSPFLAKQGHGMLLYTPVCRAKDFDVAISYLFRRFEETSSDGNFLRSLPKFEPGSSEFKLEQARFRTALAKVDKVSIGPRRRQARPAELSEYRAKRSAPDDAFINEPDTDPALPLNRKWAVDVLKPEHFRSVSPSAEVTTLRELEKLLSRVRVASAAWSNTSPKERRMILSAVADALARRRGDLINAMVWEGNKTFAEADAEVSEAIDFAHYYAIKGEELPHRFRPFGVICVAAPWNFPVAIACGGAMASLAAGNAVILKPSPATPRCGELVVECAREAGIPEDVLQIAHVPENEVGKELISESDAVVLTGASETAALFRSWKPDIRLFAETSGKNSLVISPAADLDLAVADLVASAFSNTGQRCSAASLAICIGDVYTSKRFRRQLQDAAESLVVGDAWNISTVMGPLIAPPEGKLRRALTELDEGEEWLVKPRCLDSDSKCQTWTPGIRLGVKKGSWFHMTEVFGPVLGVMQAKDLDDAVYIQNASAFGLTGGLHSLDKSEIGSWTDKVEVGNAYVNRGITGAIVQRQSFGGWKASVVGPGSKAGGPNYVTQLGTVDEDGMERDQSWLNKAIVSDELAWDEHFSKEHDPAGLFCETNVFRYCAMPNMAVRVGPNANLFEVERVRAGIERCGASVATWSTAEEESASEFASRLAQLGVGRVRTVGEVEQEVVDGAACSGIHVASNAVVSNGRVELLHYLREQSISRTRHRFGNLVTG